MTGSNMSPAWIVTLAVVLCSVLSVAAVSSSPSSSSAQCIDGNYTHDGRECCLCAAGLHLEKHCTTSPQDRRCRECPPDQYSGYPNDQGSCERCTSCSHPNENLEEDEPCTPARDRKCRCKKDHYCPSSKEICRLCYPCTKCGAEGVRVACTVNTNTVCNEKTEANHIGTTVGVIVGLIGLLALLGVAVFIWKKRKRQQTPDQLTDRNENDVEMQPLRDVDLQPYLPGIADVLGWKDMQDVAMRSKMQNATIDSFKLNHPGDSQEQTLQLLRAWAERQGREAGTNLIKNLHDNGKKGKAETVTDILSRGR